MPFVSMTPGFQDADGGSRGGPPHTDKPTETMAKTSKLAKNAERKEIVQRYAAKRLALKAVIQNPKSSDDEKREAVNALARLPRNSSATRIRNRCAMSGRPRGCLRQFGLSRIALRDMALNGFIPGVRKASW